MAIDIVLNGASSTTQRRLWGALLRRTAIATMGNANFPIENVSSFDKGAEPSFALQVGFTAPYDHPRKHGSRSASHLGLG